MSNSKVLLFLQDIKGRMSSGAKINMQQICSMHHIGKQYPTVLKNHGVIDVINGRYVWVSPLDESAIERSISRWVVEYSHKKKQIRTGNQPNPKLDFSDPIVSRLREAITIMDILKRNGVNEKSAVQITTELILKTK